MRLSGMVLAPLRQQRRQRRPPLPPSARPLATAARLPLPALEPPLQPRATAAPPAPYLSASVCGFSAPRRLAGGAAGTGRGARPALGRGTDMGGRASGNRGARRAAAGGGGAPSELPRAAFFDVDGTIVKSNIVVPFVIQKLEELAWYSLLWWVPIFVFKVIIYLAVDRFDRSRFQRMFFRNYRGYKESEVPAISALVYREYLKPKVFSGALARIRDLKAEGFLIVLVTGGLDFLVAPLAEELGVDHVVAAKLEVGPGGVFTGEVAGRPVSDAEKGARMRQYALESGVDLSRSQAYGDSTADIGMFEAVGEPFVVRPSSRLATLAGERGWPVVRWD